MSVQISLRRRLPAAFGFLIACALNSGTVHAQGIPPPVATGAPGEPTSPAPSHAQNQAPISGAPPVVGSWTALSNRPAEGIGTMLLLTDGTIMAQGGGGHNWYKLTPDTGGNYAGGTWTSLAAMHQTRLYYASAVMRNGQVFVAGGEYSDAGGDTNTAEVYDPLADAWTVISGPGWSQIGDAPVTSLADGRLLMGNINATPTALYDYTTNTWATGGSKAIRPNEETWALLPDNSVLTVDCISQAAAGPNAAERYIPDSDAWLSAGQTPATYQLVEAYSAEIGPALLMPDGNVLYIGATGFTDLYSSSTGTWQGGPDLPYVLDIDTEDQGANTSNTYNTYVIAQAKDTPGVLEVNGKVLVVAGATGYNTNANQNQGYPAGQYFFEYTPGASGAPGTFASVPSPTGSTPYVSPYNSRMINLPNGQVLFTNFGNQLYVYTPSSGPDPSWQPSVYNVAVNPDASYTVSGTQFNGLSQASSYGDDAWNATNYPLVRLTDGSGNVSFVHTYNHSTMGVATGSAVVSTNFTIPYYVSGAFSLSVVANGIASSPYSFSTGVYVDAAAAGSVFQFGTQSFPYATVNQGVSAAASGGTGSFIFIKGGSYPENLTINKAVTLTNNGGGVVTIGT